MGQRKTLGTGQIVPQNRLSTVYRFGESKTSPTGGLVTSTFRGTDFTGEKLGEGVVQRYLTSQGLWEPASKAAQLISDMGTPMTVEDLYEAVLLESWLAVPFAGVASIGLGVQTYETRTSAMELSLARKEMTQLLYPHEASFGPLSDAEQSRVDSTSFVQEVIGRMKPAKPAAPVKAPSSRFLPRTSTSTGAPQSRFLPRTPVPTGAR